MRQVRDIVRLKSAGVTLREIARRIGVAPSTVRLTLQRLVAAGLNWPLPDDLTDAALEAKLFANAVASRVIAAAESRIGRKCIAR